jgi:hypothetical protein
VVKAQRPINSLFIFILIVALRLTPYALRRAIAL